MRIPQKLGKVIQIDAGQIQLQPEEPVKGNGCKIVFENRKDPSPVNLNLDSERIPRGLPRGGYNSVLQIEQNFKKTYERWSDKATVVE